MLETDLGIVITEGVKLWERMKMQGRVEGEERRELRIEPKKYVLT